VNAEQAPKTMMQEPTAKVRGKAEANGIVTSEQIPLDLPV
jgi:hypothetical protein